MVRESGTVVPLVLLQPFGVPPTPAAAMLRRKCFPKPWNLEGAHHHK